MDDEPAELTRWDRAAERYQQFFSPVTAHLIEPLLDAAHVGAGSRVLDVGSGPGEVTAGAARRGAAVVGVDSATGMLQIAARRHPALAFKHAAAEHLPFDPAAFDAAVGNFIVEHLPAPELALAELARVLAPGGYLALTAWDTWLEGHGVSAALEAIRLVGVQPPADQPPHPSFFASSAEAAFKRLLPAAGLVDVSVRHHRFTHRFAGPDELWDGLLAMSIRTGPIIAAQSAETQRRIRAAFDRLVEPYLTAAGLDLPASATLACARKE